MRLYLRADTVVSGSPIRRDIDRGFHRVKDVFPGLINSPALKAVFDDLSILPEDVRVEVALAKTKYMRVNERDGRIIINKEHLRRASWETLYLDLIHELIHVRQFLHGMDLYDDYYAYVDRPTEIEAYAYAVSEGRRLGMSEGEIEEYLRLEWVTEDEHERLLSRLGVVAP